MSRKYKTTGCARFFLVVIILTPLAYLGASYYNGQDGWANLKRLIGIGGAEHQKQIEEQESDLREEISRLTRELKQVEIEKARLESDLRACQEAQN